jgi:hypothetical protein
MLENQAAKPSSVGRDDVRPEDFMNFPLQGASETDEYMLGLLIYSERVGWGDQVRYMVRHIESRTELCSGGRSDGLPT